MTDWLDLPQRLRDDVHRHFGPVYTAIPIPMREPWVAALLYSNLGRFCFKACPADHPVAMSAIREQDAARVIPSSLIPVPSLELSSNSHGWVTLVFEQIDGRHPELTPGSPDIPLVIETLDLLAENLSPYSRRDIPPVSGNIVPMLISSQVMLNDPDLPLWEYYDAALHGFDPTVLDEDASLLHGDLRRHKLVIPDGDGEEQVYIQDWSRIARGADWVDPMMVAIELIQAGHSPQQAEALLTDLPTWEGAPRDQVTALIAAWTLNNLHAAMHGPDETRSTRSEAFWAGRSWLHHRFAPRL
ncbi:hypothetical protein C1I98_30485 [Spongiactinospora gelatinilytica]|uniref:Uncharacterized protein n=1 Tax=Spongiactinospora gelatinilytica TaxID=2666298 RepID=A0A2W2F507_9ACTN|nr:hypothetical protein C1I98_30485 [Spongiactinospora gelatinilytica]